MLHVRATSVPPSWRRILKLCAFSSCTEPCQVQQSTFCFPLFSATPMQPSDVNLVTAPSEAIQKSVPWTALNDQEVELMLHSLFPSEEEVTGQAGHSLLALSFAGLGRD